MVRPRASDNNLRVALAFADIVTVRIPQIQSHNPSTVLVAREGGQSIFMAFQACLPALARDAHEKRPKNRRGVAVLELNKALKATGMKALRTKDRTEGGIKWRSKVLRNSKIPFLRACRSFVRSF